MEWRDPSICGRKNEAYRFPSSTPPFSATRILRDRDSSLWIGTAEGLLHMHQGRIDKFSEPEGLSGEHI